MKNISLKATISDVFLRSLSLQIEANANKRLAVLEPRNKFNF